MNDQAPPHDLNAERAVICAALLDATVLDEVLPQLRPSHFYQTWHQYYWHAITELRAEGKVPDVVLVRDRLVSDGTIEKAGGDVALMDVAEASPTAANIGHHAKIILEKADRRTTIRCLQKGVLDLVQANGDFPEIRHELVSDLRDIDEASGADGTLLPTRSVQDLQEMPEASVDWLIETLIPASAVTALAAAPKTGKSTLLFGLLRAAERGERFAGLPTRKASAVYLSEEPAALVLEKCRAFDIRESVFLVREDFDPNLSFRDCVAAAAEIALNRGAGILVIDTFARFARLGRDEEKDAGAIERALEPPLLAAGQGLSVVLVHHHRKATGEYGEQIRGSNAFQGGVDVILELRRMDGQAGNVRTLEVTGRYQGIPDEPITMELTAGRYEALGTAAQVRARQAQERVLEVVSNAAEPLSYDEIAAEVRGKRAEIRPALRTLVDAGSISRSGEGKTGKPFRFSPSPSLEPEGPTSSRGAPPASPVPPTEVGTGGRAMGAPLSSHDTGRAGTARDGLFGERE